jgi:hypothetical protein
MCLPRRKADSPGLIGILLIAWTASDLRPAGRIDGTSDPNLAPLRTGFTGRR